MDRLNEVRMEWNAELTVVLTVHVVPRGRPAGGPEHRLAEEIASGVWLAIREAEIEAAAATGDSPARD